MAASSWPSRLLCGLLLTTAIWFLWISVIVPGRPAVAPVAAPPAGEEEPFLLPPAPADPAALAAALFSYIEKPQHWCRQLAMFGGQTHGSAVDGNKFVCLDPALAPRPPCLVYSFGSRNEWSFESDVITGLGCEVHTFDPSVASPRDTHGAVFHQLGLGGSTQVTDKGWRLASLTELRAQLGHSDRPISYLKVDIEGGEWQWLEAEAEALRDVSQLGMEIHLSGGKTPDFLRRVYAVFRRLQAAGFRTVFSEVNRVWGKTWTVPGVADKVGSLYELVWVRTR